MTEARTTHYMIQSHGPDGEFMPVSSVAYASKDEAVIAAKTFARSWRHHIVRVTTEIETVAVIIGGDLT